jgi:hypothetical protein
MRLFLFDHLGYSKSGITILNNTYPTTVTAIGRKRIDPVPMRRPVII